MSNLRSPFWLFFLSRNFLTIKNCKLLRDCESKQIGPTASFINFLFTLFSQSIVKNNQLNSQFLRALIKLKFKSINDVLEIQTLDCTMESTNKSVAMGACPRIDREEGEHSELTTLPP